MKKKIQHINLPGYCYSIVTNTSGRKKLLSDQDLAYEVIEALYDCRQRYDFKLLAFAVMPDHLHLIIIPNESNKVSALVKEIKRLSSININKRLRRKGAFWQAGYFDDIIEGQKMVMNKIRYIHENPVKAGLCENPEDYEFSSANDKWEKDWGYL